MFPHQNDRGCMSMGSLGWLHGMGNVHVGVWQGGQQWAGKLSYGGDAGHICCVLNSPLKPKIMWLPLSLLSCTVSVPVLVLPSSSISPALLCFPHAISLPSSLPPKHSQGPASQKICPPSPPPPLPLLSYWPSSLSLVLTHLGPTGADGH